MGQRVVFTRPRTVEFEQYDDEPLGDRQVRLRTIYSGISAGTELTAYRGSNPYLHKRWDERQRLFVDAEETSQQYPTGSWGYEEVGEVIECGPDVTAVEPGDVIYGTWGHRTHHVVDEAYAEQRVLPRELDPILGIFSHIGAIALNGVHDGRIRIGETVAVFGLGVVGQIVAQLAKGSGSRVIGVDLLEKRLVVASNLQAVDVAINAREEAAAERIKALTAGLGADVAIEASGSSGALHEATRAVAYSARVVALGFFQGEAHDLFLGEEFHHNRVSIVGSQISGVAPDASYRWNRIRLAQSAMRLQAEGLLRLRPLITHVYPLVEAAAAFRTLDEAPGDCLQVVLDCRADGSF